MSTESRLCDYGVVDQRVRRTSLNWIDRGFAAAASLFMAVGVVFSTISLLFDIAKAQDVSVSGEGYRQLEQERESLAQPDITKIEIGDSIDIDTGSLSFYQVDVDIPGNSNLPVQFGRRLATDTAQYTDQRGLARWMVDAPFLHATFLDETGWPSDRCDWHQPPNVYEDVENQSGQIEQIKVDRDQYWTGIRMYTPGRTGSQRLHKPDLALSSYSVDQPDDIYAITKDLWRIECGPSLASGGSGPGFVAVAPNGDRYTFNVLREYDHEDDDVYTDDPSGAVLGHVRFDGRRSDFKRQNYVLWASEISDVHGNWVRFTYNDSGPTRIYSNDGRQIDITWNASDLITEVKANSRTWKYDYVTTQTIYNGNVYNVKHNLSKVTLPDSTSWQFEKATNYEYVSSDELCDEKDVIPFWVVTPTGTRIDYTVGVVKNTWTNGTSYTLIADTYGPQVTHADCEETTIGFYSAGVTQKKASVPGAAAYTWTYVYHEDPGTYSNATTHEYNKKRTITFPDGRREDHYINRDKSWTEGQVARIDTFNANGQLVQRVENTYAQGAKLFVPYGMYGGNKAPQRYLSRIAKQTTTLGSDWYVTEYDYAFTSSDLIRRAAKPITVKQYSNVSAGQRIASYAYTHSDTKWILGLTDTVTRNGKLFDDYDYDSLGRLSAYKRFGATWESFTYYTTGTAAGRVQHIDDALSNRTTFASYKRGVPQAITLPDDDTPATATITRVVDNNGWVTSETDPNGNTTGFSYNTVGWLTKIDLPGYWTDTTIAYSGLGSGVVQTATRGSERTTTTLDGMLRPTLVRRQAISGGGGSIYLKTAYDAFGRATFTSWPSTSSNPTAGVNTIYDVLGRAIQSRETVSPSAITSYAYLTGNKTRVTDPSNAVTTTASSGYGSPDDGAVVQIVDPMNAVTTFTRDIYGNVTQFKQSGTQNGYTASIVRDFKYNSRLLLCRHATPEMGDELFTYDALDRIQYASRGETSGTTCATPTAAIRTEYSYDAMGRETKVNFPDGTDDIFTTYDARGDIVKLLRGNTLWSYYWHTNGLLDRERLNVGGTLYSYNYNYTREGFLESMWTPWDKTVSYEPDGLGRPTEVSIDSTAYIDSATYHPNGQLASATLANGHSVTQSVNPRQLVSGIKSIKGTTKGADLAYVYDSRGKVTSMTNLAVTGENRAFTYDAKGRLKTASGPWGSGSFVYDALDNIRQKKLGTRTVDLSYNTDNLVSQVTDTGAATRVFTYDDRGNTVNDGRFNFLYDFSNQPLIATDGTIVTEPPEDPSCPVASVTASTDIEDAALTVDGSFDSGRWWSRFAGETITYDLGAVETVEEVRIAWGFSNIRTFFFDIQASEDGSSYQTILAGGETADTRYDVLETFDVPDTPARYIRIVANGSARNGFSWIIETEIGGCGKPAVAEPEATVSATYDYDGRFKRVQRDEDGETVHAYYSRLGELRSTINVTTDKTTEYFGIGPIKVRLVNGVVSYTIGDHLGSASVGLDSAGAVSWRESYTPFGEKRLNPAANDNEQGFTGHLEDKSTGLTYMQARYYDPVMGRFLSTDPIGYRDQFNLYAYVHNDPVNNWDPDGRDAVVLQTTFVGRRGGIRMDHQALLVGRDKDLDGNGGWTYGSANGGGPDSNEFLHFDTLQEALNFETIRGRYDRAYQTITTPLQDVAIIEEMRQEVGERYNFVANNCGDLVHDSLEAGGVDVEDTINPAAMENSLQKDEDWEDISHQLPE